MTFPRLSLKSPGDVQYPNDTLFIHMVLSDRDSLAVNSARDPERVQPGSVSATTIDSDELSSTISPLSWNVIRVRFDSMQQ